MPYYTNSFKGFVFVDNIAFSDERHQQYLKSEKYLNVTMWHELNKKFESNLMLKITPVEEYKKPEVIRAIFECGNIQELRNL